MVRKHSACKSIDAYGYPVGVYYKGQTHFQTKLGACVSFLLVAVLFIYVLARGLFLATAITDVRLSNESMDLKSMEPIQLKEHNFDVMFGFFNRGKFVFVPSKYGRFEAFQYLGRGERTK